MVNDRDQLIEVLYAELLESGVDVDDLRGLAELLADAVIAAGWPVLA